MNNNWMNLDLASMAQSLKENIRSFGGFSPEEVRRSGLMNEEGVRFAVLIAVKDGPKTGHEVIETIADSRPNFGRPSAGTVYPLLENMLDEGLIAASMKKDRRVFKITAEGEKLLVTQPVEVPNKEESGSAAWAPKWVDVRGVVPTAAARLAKVALEVSQYGTKEQQEAAAATLDKARKHIHEILSKG